MLGHHGSRSIVQIHQEFSMIRQGGGFQRRSRAVGPVVKGHWKTVSVSQSIVLVCAGLSSFEETSAVSRLVPPLANGVLVISHHSVLEGGDPFLQRTQCL